MTLKTEFTEYVKKALHIPLVGIAPPDDISPDDLERISFVVKTFAEATPLSGGNDTVLTPRDFLPEARSVFITGDPAYMGEVAGFDACREKLLGRGEPSHVTVQLLLDSAETRVGLGRVGVAVPAAMWRLRQTWLRVGVSIVSARLSCFRPQFARFAAASSLQLGHVFPVERLHLLILPCVVGQFSVAHCVKPYIA